MTWGQIENTVCITSDLRARAHSAHIHRDVKTGLLKQLAAMREAACMIKRAKVHLAWYVDWPS